MNKKSSRFKFRREKMLETEEKNFIFFMLDRFANGIKQGSD